jgi:hypothetical protein
MVGKKPEKKPFGRERPPKGYPKNQTLYADPENWRYPVHTPWHAKAARRYFDERRNRSKYTEEECTYIDLRINEALKRFETGENKGTIPRRKIDEMPINDLLRLLMGDARFKRISEIDDSLVSIDKTTTEEIEGTVKDYVVKIDTKNRSIVHDCEDWRKNMASKRMCKHLGKFLVMLNKTRATALLREIVKNKDQWAFSAP